MYSRARRRHTSPSAPLLPYLSDDELSIANSSEEEQALQTRVPPGVDVDDLPCIPQPEDPPPPPPEEPHPAPRHPRRPPSKKPRHLSPSVSVEDEGVAEGEEEGGEEGEEEGEEEMEDEAQAEDLPHGDSAWGEDPVTTPTSRTSNRVLPKPSESELDAASMVECAILTLTHMPTPTP